MWLIHSNAEYQPVTHRGKYHLFLYSILKLQHTQKHTTKQAMKIRHGPYLKISNLATVVWNLGHLLSQNLDQLCINLIINLRERLTLPQTNLTKGIPHPSWSFEATILRCITIIPQTSKEICDSTLYYQPEGRVNCNLQPFFLLLAILLLRLLDVGGCSRTHLWWLCWSHWEHSSCHWKTISGVTWNM